MAISRSISAAIGTAQGSAAMRNTLTRIDIAAFKP
jgi:hypothetical protein